jgi:hypothetical protein
MERRSAFRRVIPPLQNRRRRSAEPIIKFGPRSRLFANGNPGIAHRGDDCTMLLFST